MLFRHIVVLDKIAYCNGIFDYSVLCGVMKFHFSIPMLHHLLYESTHPNSRKKTSIITSMCFEHFLLALTLF
jgi:hypothetical protein